MKNKYIKNGLLLIINYQFNPDPKWQVFPLRLWNTTNQFNFLVLDFNHNE